MHEGLLWFWLNRVVVVVVWVHSVLMIFKIIVWGCGEEFGGALVTQKDFPWNALAHGK